MVSFGKRWPTKQSVLPSCLSSQNCSFTYTWKISICLSHLCRISIPFLSKGRNFPSSKLTQRFGTSLGWSHQRRLNAQWTQMSPWIGSKCQLLLLWLIFWTSHIYGNRNILPPRLPEWFPGARLNYAENLLRSEKRQSRHDNVLENIFLNSSILQTSWPLCNCPVSYYWAIRSIRGIVFELLSFRFNIFFFR